MEANEDPRYRGDQGFDRALRRVVERSNSPSPHPQNTCSYHINCRLNVKRLLTGIFSQAVAPACWSPPAPGGRRLDLMRASPPRRGGNGQPPPRNPNRSPDLTPTPSSQSPPPPTQPPRNYM